MKPFNDPPWRELFDRIPLGLLVLDFSKEQIVYSNPAMEMLLHSIQPISYPR
ncbi:MAG: PAS domain-containing protein, partial [Candidatus Aminicenantes bacterium]|nr:PAS domain-containing protein [Candidatus Aminicenantes bacterium]